MSKYTLFVDESGDAGISRVRTVDNDGATPYMTLGAVLIENSVFGELRSTLRQLCEDFEKSDIHCKNLNHFQKIHFAKAFSQMPLISFGVISLKETLGWYKGKIDKDSKLYYNKCAQILLECVGEYVNSAGIKAEELDIIFEKGNFAYEKLRNLIRVCQRYPIHPRVRLLKNLDADRISATPKADETLLQLSDLVAHSLFKCIDKPHACHEISEPRYLIEIGNSFYCDTDNGEIIGKGIKPIHSLTDLRLDREIHTTLNGFKNDAHSAKI